MTILYRTSAPASHRHAVNARLSTYLINLDRAPDRMNFMHTKLRGLGLEYERVAAIDGKLLSFPHPDIDERGYERLHGRRINPGEAGCYLSHIECMRRFLSSDATHALILEDDLQLCDNFCDVIDAVLDSVIHWDILRLSSVNSGRKFPVRQVTQFRSLAISLTREKGSGAYIVNRRAAKWLLDNMVPMKLPYDLAFDLEFLCGLNALFLDPMPVSQVSHFGSQIQVKRTTYRLPWWRRGVVLPYRTASESARFIMRLTRLFRFRIRARRLSRRDIPLRSSCWNDIA